MAKGDGTPPDWGAFGMLRRRQDTQKCPKTRQNLTLPPPNALWTPLPMPWGWGRELNLTPLRSLLEFFLNDFVFDFICFMLYLFIL